VPLFSLIFTLILSFEGTALAGVTADDLVVNLSDSIQSRPSLSSPELTEDLAFLKTALKKAYAGPEILHLVDKISTAQTSSQVFCDRLASVFDQVADSHLRSNLEFRACGSRPRRGQVGANLAPADRWLIKQVVHKGISVDVLAIPAFWPKFDSKWNGFLEAVKVLRSKGRPFVIDLRGNSGGDDWMGFELARILLGMPEHVNLPTPIARRRFLQTPEAFAVQSNYWAWSILRLQSLGKAVPTYMLQRRSEILSWMNRAKDGQFPAEYIEHLPEPAIDQKLNFSSAVYVLIDRACASACETTMQVMERLSKRILVGENTMGAVEYGEFGRIVLPFSRVSVSLSTMNVTFRDGRRIERLGYSPDLKVDPGGDALVEALDAIQFY
jgi:hypothetical protein